MSIFSKVIVHQFGVLVLLEYTKTRDSGYDPILQIIIDCSSLHKILDYNHLTQGNCFKTHLLTLDKSSVKGIILLLLSILDFVYTMYGI